MGSHFDFNKIRLWSMCVSVIKRDYKSCISDGKKGTSCVTCVVNPQ